MALNDTLEQLDMEKNLTEQIKDKLGNNPTEKQLSQYLSDQPQKHTYIQLELYQHWTDDNEKVKLHHEHTIRQNSLLLSHKEEDDYLTKIGLEKKVKIFAYVEELGHSYYNCHGLTFTDGKAG